MNLSLGLIFEQKTVTWNRSKIYFSLIRTRILLYLMLKYVMNTSLHELVIDFQWHTKNLSKLCVGKCLLPPLIQLLYRVHNHVVMLHSNKHLNVYKRCQTMSVASETFLNKTKHEELQETWMYVTNVYLLHGAWIMRMLWTHA